MQLTYLVSGQYKSWTLDRKNGDLMSFPYIPKGEFPSDAVASTLAYVLACSSFDGFDLGGISDAEFRIMIEDRLDERKMEKMLDSSVI